MADDKSVTWAVHIRLLCKLYNLQDPLKLLQTEDPWPKSKWKEWCTAKVRSYHEKLWREKALSNSKMTFLNIQLNGLTGRHHPALMGLTTTRDVEKARTHIKMLSGDYLTYSRLAIDRKSGDPSCRLCRDMSPIPQDTIVHVLTECRETAETRERIIPEILNELLEINPTHVYLTRPLSLHTPDPVLTQFILDCTSFNLPDQYRLDINSKNLTRIFARTRDYCYAVNSSRLKKLKSI